MENTKQQTTGTTAVVRHFGYVEPMLTKSTALKGFLPIFKQYSLFQLRNAIFEWLQATSIHEDVTKYDPYYLTCMLEILDTLIGNVEGYNYFKSNIDIENKLLFYLKYGAWYKYFSVLVRLACEDDFDYNYKETIFDLHQAFFTAAAVEGDWNLEHINN